MNPRLELATYAVKDVVWGHGSAYRSGTLAVDRHDVDRLAADESTFESITVHIVKPGERTRLVHLLDAVEPRWKASGPGGIFPGILGSTETVGEGRTHRLGGLALIQAARPPQEATGLLQPREAVMDMWGEGARYSPFGDCILLALEVIPKASAGNADFDAALRRFTCRLAEWLAKLTAEDEPTSVKVFQTGGADCLPKVGYFYQLSSVGIFSDTYLYGRPVEHMVPTLIHPNEVLDGALVGGNYLYAPYHIPTFLHQNNPVLLECYRRHGRELDFRSVVLARGHNYTQMDKERCAHYAANLFRLTGCDAVVLTGEGGGNSAIDMMLTCRYLEEHGIKTCVLSYELGGPSGADFPLLDWVPQADAIVSAGITDTFVQLEAPDRVIGGDSFVNIPGNPRQAQRMTLHDLYLSTSQVGAGCLAAAAF